MSTKGKRRILASDTQNSVPSTIEAVAATATILPGMVLSLDMAGLQPSAVASTAKGQRLLIAADNATMQKSVDDLYTVGENVVAYAPNDGEAYNAMVSAGNNITSPGIALTRSATAGELKIAATDGTEEIVAYSDEAINVATAQLVRITK